MDRSPPAQPITSPPGAQGAYRFADSPMGGTHLTAVIVSVILSSSLAWTTHRRRHHVHTVTVTSSQIFVGHHGIDLIPSVYWQVDRSDSRPAQASMPPPHPDRCQQGDDDNDLVSSYKIARSSAVKP
jgi:hypothetical protein